MGQRGLMQEKPTVFGATNLHLLILTPTGVGTTWLESASRVEEFLIVENRRWHE